ncbi:MAG: hypothetical protein FJ146_13130 [Deltaproteobacteria bacterium]|nr:hypothetical protein [Deltaproteobacteria bacterium]
MLVFKIRLRLYQLVSLGLFVSSTVLARTKADFPVTVNPDDIISAPDVEDRIFLAVFGDSVSMATMADAKLGQPGPRFYADFLASIAAATTYDATLGKLKKERTEDEQHRLLTAFFGNMARLHLSPLLGRQDYSLPVLIEESHGNKPLVYNGARMAGAYHFGHLYLATFRKFLERHPFIKKPDLIIVNFNGMDFMEGWPLESYAENVRSFYLELTQLAPQANLVVTGMADPVPLLTAPDRVTIPNSPAGPITCSQLYKIVRFGNKTGLYPGAPEEVLDAARQRVLAMNDTLEAAVAHLNDDRSMFPEYKGQAIFVPPMTGGDGANHIAADCIHPDKFVQEAIGRHLWPLVEPLL